MRGDFSRQTFDPARHYNGVLQQQGRVQLDADWNEAEAIALYRDQTTAKDVIGLTGAPRVEPASESPRPARACKSRAAIFTSTNLSRTSRTYRSARSLICRAPRCRTLTGLPSLPRSLGAARRSRGRAPELREKALGGVDTTTRSQTVCR